MSAAAARRKKQLAARAAEQQQGTPGTGISNSLGLHDNNKDIVLDQLDKLLNSNGSVDVTKISEEIAYEALQLAQSSIRKRIQTGKYDDGCNLAYNVIIKLFQTKHISIISQLLQLLADILRETHTIETTIWIQRIIELNTIHQNIINTNDYTNQSYIEYNRLQRLHKVWLICIIKWSSELGTIKYGNQLLHELLGELYWKLSTTISSDEDNNNNDKMDIENDETTITTNKSVVEKLEFQCEAIQHFVLAEKPLLIIQCLKTLSKPTLEQLKTNHSCLPCIRDILLTRSILLLVTLENLRDANIIIQNYISSIEERTISDLIKNYTNKNDPITQSHIVFCSMLLRIVEKDYKTGPLYQWLMKSFKRELDSINNNTNFITLAGNSSGVISIQTYVTKIGKIYFNIEPPPSMLKMMENMFGGGSGSGSSGGMGGGLGGIDPAMMQAALAQMTGGGGM